LQEYKDSIEDQVQSELSKRLTIVQLEVEEKVQEAVEQQRSAEKRCQAALETVKQLQYNADRAQVILCLRHPNHITIYRYIHII
jgi:hypothetical protein